MPLRQETREKLTDALVNALNEGGLKTRDDIETVLTHAMMTDIQRSKLMKRLEKLKEKQAMLEKEIASSK